MLKMSLFLSARTYRCGVCRLSTARPSLVNSLVTTACRTVSHQHPVSTSGSSCQEKRLNQKYYHQHTLPNEFLEVNDLNSPYQTFKQIQGYLDSATIGVSHCTRN